MPTGRIHPHLDRPSKKAIREVLAHQTPAIRELAVATHALVLATLPGITSSMDMSDGMIGYGAHQYGHGGWGVVVVSAHAKWVNLTFIRGAELDDPAGILGGSGKQLRHVRLRSAQELEEREPAIVALLEAAASS